MQLLSMASTVGANNSDEESERELIDAEFESMVAGLSLDESTPTTFLDELDSIPIQHCMPFQVSSRKHSKRKLQIQ
jgi:hypothetical protein